MKNPSLAGKKYFYALGQSVRSRGLNRSEAEEFFKLNSGLPHCRIAFDKGYRGLPL